MQVEIFSRLLFMITNRLYNYNYANISRSPSVKLLSYLFYFVLHQFRQFLESHLKTGAADENSDVVINLFIYLDIFIQDMYNSV